MNKINKKPFDLNSLRNWKRSQLHLLKLFTIKKFVSLQDMEDWMAKYKPYEKS